MAQRYHVDASAIRKLNFFSRAINPDGSLNPGHDIKLPIDAYEDSTLAALVPDLHTLIRGGKHDISGHSEWNVVLRRFSSSGFGAPSNARGPSEKLMTPDEYIESILTHLGSTDEDFFNPKRPRNICDSCLKGFSLRSQRMDLPFQFHKIFHHQQSKKRHS